MFLGYSAGRKGYKIFSLETKKIIASQDVRFYETKFPHLVKSIDGSVAEDTVTLDAIPLPMVSANLDDYLPYSQSDLSVHSFAESSYSFT